MNNFLLNTHIRTYVCMYFALIINFIIKLYLKLNFLETCIITLPLRPSHLISRVFQEVSNCGIFRDIFLMFPEVVQDIELNLGDASKVFHFFVPTT